MKTEITISSVKTIVTLPEVVLHLKKRAPKDLGFSDSGKRDSSFLIAIRSVYMTIYGK
jgi:hypothetical protein